MDFIRVEFGYWMHPNGWRTDHVREFAREVTEDRLDRIAEEQGMKWRYA